MALSFKQGAIGTASSTPGATANFGTTSVAGNLMVVYIGQTGGSNGNITGVTDTVGSTYTAIPSFEISNSGGTLTLSCWSATVNASGTNKVNVAFNASNTDVAIVAQEFQGFTGTPTFDKKQTSSNTSSTTATSGATATTTQANEIVIGGAVHASTVSAYTLGTGYTNLTQESVASMQTAMESKVVAATGAQTATFTIAAARVNIGGVVTFYDAAAGTLTVDVSDSTTTSENTDPETNNNIAVSDNTSISESVVPVDVVSPANISVSDSSTTSELVGTPAVSYGVNVEPGAAYTINGLKVV